MRWWHGYALLWGAVLALGWRDMLHFARTFRPAPPTGALVGAALLYVLVLALLSQVLPGHVQVGALLSDGRTRLRYTCNGLAVACVAVILFALAVGGGVMRGAAIADAVPQLFLVGIGVVWTLSTFLFVQGRATRRTHWLKPRGALADFVLGATLNPTIGGIDLKFFSYRPAMIGWLLINLSFLCKQREELGFVTRRMVVYQALTAWYIWDYFVNESKMVFTWDIIAEHYGLMLVWADYVFIPFSFSIQNFYLLHDTRLLSVPECALILAVFSLGVTIFRGANSQKHQFKMNPSALIWGKPPKVVGGRLLVSGYWGVARHLNYTGDLLLALSYCLPCGRTSPLAYFYFFYLLLLCVHREKRDDERCAAKYKAVWDEYCMRVPYRMLPFVY